MNIKNDTIDYVAALAKIELCEEEKEKAKEDLSKILGYMDLMNELNTDSIDAMSHVLPLKNVFREDEVTNNAEKESMLSNAPLKKDGSFMVPKTFI